MMIRSTVIGAIATVMLAAGGTFYFVAQSGIEEQIRDTLDTVRQMQHLAAQWRLEISRMQADPNANFDALAEFVPMMIQLRTDLLRKIQQIPELSKRAESEARGTIAAMELLRERVERFKTTYAVIRNSERYLPVASVQLVELAELGEDRELARNISDLTEQIVAFLASPTEPDVERLNERLQVLMDAGDGRSPSIVSLMSSYEAHARVLLAKRGRAKELLEGIASTPVDQTGKPLIALLEFERRGRQLTRALNQRWVMAICGGLFLAWVFVSFMRRNRRADYNDTVDSGDMVSIASVTSQLPPEPANVSKEATAQVDARKSESSPVRRELTRDALIVRLLGTGAVVGLLGQTMGTYARRMRDTLSVIDENGVNGLTDDREENERIHRWRSLVRDARRVEYFAQCMMALARRQEPMDQSKVDVNACLDEVLEVLGASATCTVRRCYELGAHVNASKSDVWLIFETCLDKALRTLRDPDCEEPTLDVSTALGDGETTVRISYKGQMVAQEQHSDQFIPFYSAHDRTSGIVLPTALYLAKRNHGAIGVTTLADDRIEVRVHLPVP